MSPQGPCATDADRRRTLTTVAALTAAAAVISYLALNAQDPRRVE
ncbi:hypothetical protein AB0O51_26090 [Streptomyces sp. NPDC090301]